MNFSFSICSSWNSDSLKLYKPFNAAICLYLVRVRSSNIFVIPTPPERREGAGGKSEEKQGKAGKGEEPALELELELKTLLSSAFDVYCKRDRSGGNARNVIIDAPHDPTPVAGFSSSSSSFSSCCAALLRLSPHVTQAHLACLPASYS